MSGKNQYPVTFNWSATDPRTGFVPANNPQGSSLSGTLGGAMASTNVIYSNICEVGRMDNIGLEAAWTGTPTGALAILVSNSGLNWNAITFTPTLAQPAGGAGGMAISINQLPWKYIMLQYTNASGSGTLKVFGQAKDLN